MKKNTRPHRHKNEDNPILFGVYHRNSSQQFVVVGNQQYAIGEIKRGLPELAHLAKVKVLLRSGLRGKPENVVILRVLGPEPSLAARIERMLSESQIPVSFPDSALREAALLGEQVLASDQKNRLDLSKLALCTIDGETAKDFDDAVFAQAIGNNIEVTVAIADVSHYVKLGSALDEEALNRGTSVYYPGACVPMLPESLSNGLCSLKPAVIRLALSVSFELGSRGRISKTRINAALIKSQARLSYNQVQAYYDQPELTKKIPPAVKESLILLKKAAHILRRTRERRGALDFDLVESVVALDSQGEPLAINPQTRLDAHRIIEDLMVATNEIVAEFFERRNIPCLYRVHEPPNQEKLENFFKTAQAFGVIKAGVRTKAAEITEPKALQAITASFASSKYKDSLTNLMLRAMMQARYSAANLMHFGLASSAYLHFTSPIRRYADLIVHRQLRYVLLEKKHHKKLPEAVMEKIAESISQKEIKATDLERKIDRLFSATFMAAHVGEVFEAVITTCTEFGCFVRISEHHVEGLVHIATISKSRVNFVPEKLSLVVSGSNKAYMVGDKVRVKLLNVNVERGHIDCEFDQYDPD